MTIHRYFAAKHPLPELIDESFNEIVSHDLQIIKCTKIPAAAGDQIKKANIYKVHEVLPEKYTCQ